MYGVWVGRKAGVPPARGAAKEPEMYFFARESWQCEQASTSSASMRALIQRSQNASVSIAGEVVGSITHGLVVLLGVEHEDTTEDAEWLAGKIAQMRIFGDAEGKMNLWVKDVNGGVLVVSQFTLHASTKKGNRPSFIRAARPDHAVPMYEHFMAALEKELSSPVQRGVFGADMQVALTNDGPVTIWMDSRARE